ncbi:MAG: RidA family protein, partial [Pseudomonadales bacterium]
MQINHHHSSERMSKIVTHNKTVYLCGQVADSAQWDITEQSERCLAQIDQLLDEVGSSRSQILSTTIYLRDIKDFAAMNQVWDAWISGADKPARACV